jgi:hypothetical protein
VDGQRTLLSAQLLVFAQLLAFAQPLVFAKPLVFAQPLLFGQPLPQAAQAAPKRWLLQTAGISQWDEAPRVDALVTPDYNSAALFLPTRPNQGSEAPSRINVASLAVNANDGMIDRLRCSAYPIAFATAFGPSYHSRPNRNTSEIRSKPRRSLRGRTS